MTDKEKIVHDLALIYAQEKYHEFFRSAPQKAQQFPTGVSKLADFYHQGVVCIAPQIDEIMKAYLDADGRPLIEA